MSAAVYIPSSALKEIASANEHLPAIATRLIEIAKQSKDPAVIEQLTSEIEEILDTASTIATVVKAVN